MVRNRIAKVRQLRGLSAQELAKRLGSVRSTIVKLERGERTLSTEWLERFAEELDIAPEQLFDPLRRRIVWAPRILFEDISTWMEGEPKNQKADTNFLPIAYHRETVVAVEITDGSLGEFSTTAVIDYEEITLLDGQLYAIEDPETPNGVTARVFFSKDGPRRLVRRSGPAGRGDIYAVDRVKLAGRIVMACEMMSLSNA